MIACPCCKKGMSALGRECPTCKADLSLLVEFVGHLDGGVDHARKLARAGRLGEAVFAYLEVLDIDPENAEARRQVGLVATAVRQFDSTRQFGPRKLPAWVHAVWLIVAATALGLGFFVGHQTAMHFAERNTITTDD